MRVLFMFHSFDRTAPVSEPASFHMDKTRMEKRAVAISEGRFRVF